MALDQSALLELLGELQHTDVSDRIRSATEKLYQELIDAEATAFIGAAPFERSVERVAQRNGTRPRTLTTTAGQLDLRIPKLRSGSSFPPRPPRQRGRCRFSPAASHEKRAFPGKRKGRWVPAILAFVSQFTGER
ncbi:hypothetical protein ABA31_19590 [Agrococcus baldri]|uniref:Mutator family transposase n=1 Tax=Agrococcus baldri TaxID=153730 RepID=A0AA87US81_9MICO|nr:hypothetical protein ABA31_19590 [Agrococcus baldri]